MSDSITTSLTERFHSVQSVLPNGQHVVGISPDAPVSDALALLVAHPFSQLVVMEGRAVFGLFSYRSFATRVQKMGGLTKKLDQLPVEEFMEKVGFARSADSWESLLPHVDREDAVLVGNADDLKGIVTPMDFVYFLKHAAEPFVVIAEIEQALRDGLRAVTTPEELHGAAVIALASIYGDNVPTDLSEMTFSDYVQILNNKRNWPQFAPLFGQFGHSRNKTFRNLEAVRKLRNDVFHFKRKIEQDDLTMLQAQRNWLRQRLRIFEAAQAAAGSVYWDGVGKWGRIGRSARSTLPILGATA